MSTQTTFEDLDLAILTDELSLDLEAAILAGKALGIRRYELRCVDTYEQRVPDLKPCRREQLQAWVQQGELAITALSPGLFKLRPENLSQLKAELEQTLPATCEWARELGAPCVIVFGFLRSSLAHPVEVIARLREAAQVAAAFGLKLAIENEPGAYCDTGARTAEIVATIGEANLGINWDPANAVVAGEAAYPVGYERVRPWLQNVHVKDAIPLLDGTWANRLLGDGGVNWWGQLAALRRDRPVDHVTLETHVLPLLPSTRENLRRWKALRQATDVLLNTERS
ncbi:MAG: xylose isomerase domain-containing protein [Puniceicoccaceae bacterium 5H]|nr:MAG: xylose isomerase domain-containing protein [Puniceicoccaceae bacterium 5H]